ncbi:GNAT family N-acetyltransferase [Oscillochloris sp. ZM17-4]|uniref:GNAT family N-acetyltransferase n=1 Tax=Oscillochloris sp. ZM17-4 TaxID=2866714 RepID=UPI001C72D3CE|nr:N-acetyltransferase [Oscillochloris sp. ZM17-4]MBX0331056.1 GNAT family N-acetyltransferase [Oscillochloris sp. ZM17-4]
MTTHALQSPHSLVASSAPAGPAIAAVIRPARLDDIAAIVDLHSSAFADTFGGAFGHGHIDQGARALAAAWRRQGAASMRGMLVAEHEGHLIGTTTLRTWEMGGYDTSAAELAFQEVLGVWGATRSLFALSLLDHRIGHHEGFLADVAVLETYRRSGVARSLLARAEEDARARHKRFLGLYVSASNGGARTLYHSLGFVDAHTRRSPFAWLLFGQGTWHYMRKSLL